MFVKSKLNLGSSSVSFIFKKRIRIDELSASQVMVSNSCRVETVSEPGVLALDAPRGDA